MKKILFAILIVAMASHNTHATLPKNIVGFAGNIVGSAGMVAGGAAVGVGFCMLAFLNIKSLMRYSMGLIIKSAPGNVKEYFEHFYRQQGKPISPHDKITDEEIRRLFG